MIVGVIVLAAVGVLLTVLGLLIWKKEKINLLHDYHRDKVKDEDKKAFCKLSGSGVFIIGAALLMTGVVLAFTDSAFSFIVFGIGFILGISLLVSAGKKYNG